MAPSTVSSVSDLRVERKSCKVVYPEKIKERRALFLSNMDQQVVHYVQKYVHFFSAPSLIPFDIIFGVHEEALSKTMVAYDFMCGRLMFNSEQGRFEIDCNAAGVPLAICVSELSLQELGNLAIPNPAFSQLCLPSDSSNPTLGDGPLVSFQVTRFKCGAFALGSSVNHCLMDGFSIQGFARNFTHMAIKGEPAFIPITDRTCLKARTPLQIKYEHEEYVRPSETTPDKIISSLLMRRNKELWYTKVAANKASEKHIYKLFSLSGKMINALKMKAADGMVKHCTSFVAALAHVWRARAAAMGNLKPDDVSTVHYVADIRSRLVPPLPREYVGNAMAPAYAKATFRQLEEEPFGETVKKLQEGVDRLIDEYLRSSIDWLELYDGVPVLENGFHVTNWKNLGFADMELRGGIKSLHSGPVLSGGAKVVRFLGHPEDNQGMQLYIGLEASHMNKFEKLIETI
ncbi:acyltransferase GLAUCE-like [Cryptomeria japonica]|uniref:acyltransferase GLAUCE-like n=1 Tax=Cryptomeria japonica TaxID=3369 RepID=UPI0027DA5971|nr:acyltransferase GLAUCE-like [Cryptomeria japonica]